MNEPPATTCGLALAVLREHAGALQGRAEGARSGENPRDVHQMRVATRRLRAALRVFEDVLPDEGATLNDELRWLARLLGDVRDLDVQLGHTQQRAAELDAANAMQPYIAWLEVQREQAREALIQALDSARYTGLRGRLERAAGEWHAQAEQPVRVGAAPRIRPLAKKLWRSADGLGAASPAEELHRARIRAKRLRYAVEFYAPVFGGPAKEVASRAVAVQDLLGEHQDTVVAAERVRQALRGARGTWPAETAFALGAFVQRDAGRAAEIRVEFSDVYRRLRKGWKRLRAELAAR